MELLPIIYQSLLYAGILASVVIVVSFIAFQFRKKYGNIPSEEVQGKERNKKVTVTNPDKKPKTEKKHHPKVQTRSRQKKVSAPHKDKNISSSDSALYKKPTRDSHKKRIEIVNPDLNDDQSSEKETKYHSLKIDSRHNDWN